MGDVKINRGRLASTLLERRVTCTRHEDMRGKAATWETARGQGWIRSVWE